MARITTKVSLVDDLGNTSRVDILQGYDNFNIDEASDPKYYGFVDTDGNWVIRKMTNNESTFARGITDHLTAWTGRAGLTYGTFDNVF